MPHVTGATAPSLPTVVPSDNLTTFLVVAAVVAVLLVHALLPLALLRPRASSSSSLTEEEEDKAPVPTTATSAAGTQPQPIHATGNGMQQERGTQTVGDSKPAMVIVDPYSSGGVLARLAHDRGYQVVRVLSLCSQRMADQSLPKACQGLPFAATIIDEGDPDATLARIKALGLEVAGVLCGAEPGVELFDALTSRWHQHFGEGKRRILSNGEALSHARRNKYDMSERVRAAGLRAVEQVKAKTWGEAAAFIASLFPHVAAAAGGSDDGIKVILKPARSSSSEDVVLAHSLAEARAAFHRIASKRNQYGEANDCVLVQEFLQGVEYVVNCVSLDGEHKIVSLWRYDKRPANGSPFIYHGVELMSGEGEEEAVAEALTSYITGVLDALGIRHGPSHAEVMLLHDDKDGPRPCLVEIGCRPHGGDGVHTEIARRCVGYHQLDAMIDLFEHLDDEEQQQQQQQQMHDEDDDEDDVASGVTTEEGEEEEETASSVASEEGEEPAAVPSSAAGRASVGMQVGGLRKAALSRIDEESGAAVRLTKFHALPPRPPRPLRAHGRVVMLVAYRTGKLVGYPGLAAVQALPSFQDVALKVQPGQRIETTVDYLTNPGWVMLVHEDPAVVAADAATIHALAKRSHEEGGLYHVAEEE